jgi:hypothetical protein
MKECCHIFKYEYCLAHIEEGKQVCDPIMQNDKCQARLKKMLGFVSRLIYNVPNTCDSLGGKRIICVRNDYLQQRTLQCFIWIL